MHGNTYLDFCFVSIRESERKAPTTQREKESKRKKKKTIKDGQRGFEHDDVLQKSLRHSLRQSRHARGHARPRRRR